MPVFKMTRNMEELLKEAQEAGVKVILIDPEAEYGEIMKRQPGPGVGYWELMKLPDASTDPMLIIGKPK